MTYFDEYIKQGEPSKKEKAIIWRTAIGLQQVDGLKPSAYLIEIARQNIEGHITIAEVKNRIAAYYEISENKKAGANNRTKEVTALKGGQKRWSENLAKVFDLIRKNPRITRKELSETLQINPSAVQKHIEKLKNERKIVRAGSDKGGSWKIIKSEEPNNV